ncbi:MAG: T9SS type A sorting domain-containing protein [Flavobacterium sp.]|uniref:T9SS type A sorting domain-containing protein n=1 Tax=Flavobacterium sp. TaxID=239 RepID=UPI0022BADE61|nr:T9SS type A sorting domain-containing protein [Flavobacterium sp.]MCZ8197219.1 T9SS type A sorting domain-containing protein [Flavobacterium sp.]
MKTKLLLLLAVVMTAFSVNAQTIAIVGEAAGGWPGDPGNPGPTDIHQMTSTDGINWTYTGLVLTNAGEVSGCSGANCGGVKFRQDNAWAINWGSASFPSGTGTQGGTNIQCLAGTYDVTFNSVTGEYNFSGGAPIPVVKLVGTAVTGGTVTMNAQTLTTFTLPLTTFLDGTAQFEVDGELAGGTGFPTGTFVDATQFIPVVAGAYTSVTVNIETGEYVFTAAPLYPLIGLIGSGTTGNDAGWGQDIDMTTSNGVNYKLSNQELFSVNTSNGNPGGLKFRENNEWTNSWGGVSFPNGPIAGDNNDIIVTAAGTYNSYFNYTTKAYNFVKVGSISLVGDAVGGWPDSPGNPGPVDINMMSTTDDENYTLTNLTVVAGGCKFRQDNDWSIPSFGSDQFPAGTDTNNDIIIEAGEEGTYDVTFKKSTKEYTFTPSLATTSFAKSNFKVYPNPSNTNWNFTSAKDVIISIQVVDMLGKVVATSTSTTVDASALTTGVYFAKVATATATETIKVVKN